MKISVIIPCHNAGPLIERALKSVAAQTLTPHEVIVIDDGSTDDSVQRIGASGVEVKLLSVEHRNAAAARNSGVAAAGGDWLAFLDSDDYWYPHHLQHSVDALSKTNDVAYMAHHDIALHDGEIIPCPRRVDWRRPHSGLSDEVFIHQFLFQSYFSHGGVLCRRDRFLAVGGYNSELRKRHDFEMFMRVIHDHTWTFAPEPEWAYSSETEGAISRDILSCEEYHLKALLLNREHYGEQTLTPSIQATARRIMVLSSRPEIATDRRREAISLARPFFSERDQWLMRLTGGSSILINLAFQSKQLLSKK